METKKVWIEDYSESSIAVFGCEGKIYVPLRSGLHELINEG